MHRRPWYDDVLEGMLASDDVVAAAAAAVAGQATVVRRCTINYLRATYEWSFDGRHSAHAFLPPAGGQLISRAELRRPAPSRCGLQGAVGRLRGCGSGRAHVRGNMSISSPRRRDGVYVLPFTDERARADLRRWSPVMTRSSSVQRHSYAIPVSPRLLGASLVAEIQHTS